MLVCTFIICVMLTGFSGKWRSWRLTGFGWGSY